jgi:outer membrane protein assembly factor BamB
MMRWIMGAVLAGAVVAPAGADNWPGWRGPTHDGVAPDTGYPLEWSATKNVTWKTPIPGRGHSSPVVWGDRIFLMTCLEGPDPKKDKATPRDRQLVCLDRKDGSILWQKTVVTAPLEKIHPENSWASSTPATDGKHVYVTTFDDPKVIVAAYDFDGKEVWKKSPGEFQSQHGFGIPPVLYKDLVIINCDQDGFNHTKPAYIVALDKVTGEEKWRIDRKVRIRSYTPPLIVEAGGRMQMVLTGAKNVDSYDPDTGKPIWHIDGPTEQFVASLIFHQGHFYLTAGFPTFHVMCIKPDGTGNVTKSHVVWHETKGAGYVPSPVAVGDNIFLVKDDGVGSCRDTKTGKLHWLERVGRHAHSSPVAADGRIYFIDDDGVTQVIKAAAEFEPLAKNTIGEPCFSSPALSNGQIFMRGEKHLFCIGKEKSR